MSAYLHFGVPKGIWTPVACVKGRNASQAKLVAAIKSTMSWLHLSAVGTFDTDSDTSWTRCKQSGDQRQYVVLVILTAIILFHN